MAQRKLTDEELQVVMDARFHVRQVAKFSNHAAHFHESLRRLDEMANHQTTDGKPYVEPQPPIPDGYRLAVAGEELRADCKLWSLGLGVWKMRTLNNSTAPFSSHNIYIVPIDRIPTDEEAQKLPVVMVRDYDDRPWQKARLVRVSEGSYTCLAASRRNFETWSQCRHLYSNETP